MVMHTNDVASRRFVFGDFALHPDGILVYQQQQQRVPPKELAVLITLLESAGELVSKDTLLNKVWPHHDVNEESLTRCIYALRRILQESKGNRYIDTIYGKGYRFSRPVTRVARGAEPSSPCTIAILPFRTHDELDAFGLHDTLVKGLSRYAEFGLQVLPTALTHQCRDAVQIITLMDQLQPDYYLAGQTLRDGNGWSVSMELVRAKGHRLVHHECLALPTALPLPQLQRWLSEVLLKHIPGMPRDLLQPEPAAIDSALAYLDGRHALLQLTPSSLNRALPLLRQAVASQPVTPQPYLALAECYLTLAQFGLFEQEQAIQQAGQAVEQALSIDARHPCMLGLKALMTSITLRHAAADPLFEHLLQLAPDDADVHYYYAWHLFLSGRLSQAKEALALCMRQDPSRISASILTLWATYYSGELGRAIELAQQLLQQHGTDHPVLQSMLALLLTQQGEHAQAANLLDTVRERGEELGLLAVNRGYIDFCRKREAALPELRSLLANNDNHQLEASLLPLILAIQGKAAAQQQLRHLQQKGDPWLPIWLHDPRLGQVVDLRRPKEVAA